MQVIESAVGGGNGSDGDPGTITIKKFGPHLFGLIETSGSVYQGYRVNVQDIYLPWKGKIIASKNIDLTMKNDGAVGCDEHPNQCDDLHFDMHMDDSNLNVEVYSLIVKDYGIQQGKKVLQTYEVPFNLIKGQYQMPSGLQQGY